MTDAIGLQSLEQALSALSARVSSLREAKSAYPADPRSTLDAALAELDTARELLETSVRELRKAPKRSGQRENGAQRELKLLRQVFRTFPVPVVVLDTSGVVRRVSAETSRMLGSPAGYLIGRSFPLFVDVSRRAAFRSHLTAVQQGGQTATFQTRLAHQGRAHTVQLAVTRLTMPGEPQEMVAVVILPLEAQVAGPPQGPADRSDATLVMAAARRQELLARMTRLLLDEESLRQPVTVTRAARLLASESADWVIADVVRDDVPVRACVLGPSDKPVTQLVRLAEQMNPLTAPAVAHVLTGGSGMVHEMLEDEGLLGDVPGGPSLLRVMGAASVLIVPIGGADGVLGALTLVRLRDREPFSLADLGLLEEIGVHLGLALRARRSFQTRSRAADALRTSVVPRSLPDIPGFEAAAIYNAGSSPVGAEFYDVFPTDEGWGFALGGAVGKGEEAASVSAMVRNGLRVLSVWESDPGEVMRKLNQALIAQHNGMFVMAVTGFIRARKIRLASAGHHPAALLQPDGGVRFTAGGGVPLGIAPEAEMFTEELTPASGQTLVFYSDGLVASQNELGESYGETRLADVLARCVTQSPSEIVKTVEEDRHVFSGGRVWDEIVILALRVV
ncbi:SpoIIE family protein phosphatase [Streptosporangium sp. NBC_01755]|uniref:SpoIIE family protein phosphatase n=1 Tax=unclassified Streptosporangium TaxID=2632669 RepID=UPI002DDA082F|nr:MULTISPECIES: SpoIIE family protein phosphatase [unclassified Streptosporangium]WSA29400.1 SpoIIE family protein phosphatase [Streptosporangium sp. NBC_01810]WSC99156.1 SpoIIE family protein phosphatase [Streptosporangium sp. NBC_01755]